MQIDSLEMKGLYLIKPKCFMDERGYFLETYRQSAYNQKGIDVAFVQDNAAFSKKGVLRGLHYQDKPGQAKLVSVSFGSIWDVAVDLRPDSESFGKWCGVELNDHNHYQLFIPVGFAHGYCVLSEEGAVVSYKVSADYNPAMERSVRWDDPHLAINWPIKTPILSLRDQQAPLMQGASL